MNMEKTSDIIVGWLREKVKEAGANGLVIGLSGGIDSSVVAALCKKAFPENCFGLIMPCESDSQDTEHARRVAEKFGIESESVDLNNAFKQILSDLSGKAKGSNEALAAANIKPRLRMISLYYFANRLKCLVAGTDNKAELMVGYFTKFGDGGVDLLPIAGLLKRDVRKLAAHLGVPKEIIEKPPSAGLWQGQTDEQEMGITYGQLDNALEKIGLGQESSLDKEVLAKVKQMISSSEHKRMLAPICKIEGALQ